MQANPYKLEEPPEKPSSWWTFKLTPRSGFCLTLAVLAGVYIYFTIWLYKRVTINWPTVSYIDCAFYLLREKSIHKKQGEYLLGKAKEAEDLGHVSEAIRLYSSGLELAPAYWEIRLKLVRMSLAEGRGYGVPDLLRAGMRVSSHENRYLDSVINIAWEIKDYALMIEACEVAIKSAAVSGGHEIWISRIIEKRALALVESGAPAKALASLPVIADDSPIESVIERVTLLLRLQLPVDTINFIEKWAGRYPDNLKLLRLWARSQREINDLKGMEETMARCIARNPDAREAWSAVVVNRALVLDLAGARVAMEKYFVKFYGRPDDLMVLGLDLALIGNRELLAECLAESDRNGYSGIDLRKLLVEMEVNRSGWEASRRLLGEIAIARRRLGLPEDNWYSFYNSFCEAALYDDEEKQTAFLELLRAEKSVASPDALESFIRLLCLEGRYDTSREIAQIGRSRFPEYRDWLQYVRHLEAR